MTAGVLEPAADPISAPAQIHCAHCLVLLGLSADEELTAKKPDDLHFGAGARSDARFAPGSVIGDRFRITGFLGRGGMGQVYRARDLKLGQNVAIKFIAHERPTDHALRLFYDEVRLGRQVTHPSVCRVHELLEIDGLSFIVMELVDGENLASLLQRMGKLAYRDALRIAREVCAGVSAAHERGIVHGDLKPANVMLDERGHARITDFGLARLAADASREGRGGTIAYMAPEQRQGSPSSRRTDLYALGLLLYEIFTGQRPQTSDRELTRPSALQPRVPADVERIILACLATDPLRRPESAREVMAVLGGGDALDAVLVLNETPSPEYVAASRKVAGLRRRHTWMLGALSAILIGLLLFLSDRLTLYGRAARMQPPSALAARARQIAVTTGALSSIADEGHWFEPNLRAFSRGIEQAIEFHYRASPRPLAPLRADGILRRDDPPPTDPGMVHVVLASDGLLLRVHRGAAGNASTPSFEALPAQRLAEGLYTFMLMASVLAGLVLARSNIRLRRVDGRGAARLGLWVFCCRAIYGLGVSHHPLSLEQEPGHLAAIFGAALTMSAEVVIAYLALEPFVRRRWPTLMIGWMRFGHGRVLDNVVGREILAGVAAGLTFRLLDQARNAAPLILPSARVTPSHLAVDALSSLRVAVGEVFYDHARAIFYALFALFLLLLLQLIVRSERAAMVLWLILATGMFIRWGDVRVDVPVVALQMLVLLIVMRRAGLLALIAAIFVALLTVEIPLTIDPARFYFGSSTLVVAIVAVLVSVGVAASVSRRWAPPSSASRAAAG